MSPARMGNGAGRGRFVVIRGCPLVPGGDRCEWHASGTAAEDDPGIQLRGWLHSDRRLRTVFGDHCLVGKSSRARGSRMGETRTCVGKARRLLDLLWHWRSLELSRAFPLAATAGRDGQPPPTGWKASAAMEWAPLRPSCCPCASPVRKWRPAQMRASMSSASACEKLPKVRVLGSVGARKMDALVIWEPPALTS